MIAPRASLHAVRHNAQDGNRAKQIAAQNQVCLGKAVLGQCPIAQTTDETD
jgi:hypothetical protein